MAQAAEPGARGNADREALILQGVALVALSVTWMVVEGVVSLSAGIVASSVALLAFGVDSFIELASDLIVAWRLMTEKRGASEAHLERVERRASRMGV